MSENRVDIERQTIAFEKVANKYFRYLIEKYSFEMVYSDLYCVKFLSEYVYVNVYHEKLSYEMDFVIGLKPEHIDNKLYAKLENIIDYYQININIKIPFCATSRESVEKFIAEIAKLLKDYGEKLIKGDRDLYKEIAEVRSRQLNERVSKQNLLKAEHQAIIAWDNRDFDRVISIYSNIAPNLNKTQRKRLELAKKKRKFINENTLQ